ncbi:MAG: hypothetical protein PHI35_03770 [Victivallaceae bacterium]|nr:hypothetical protein [Victivallaceae bacterium]
MTRLVDRWSPGVALLMTFVKLLQFLKKCGMKATENGWRKAAGVFMQSEASKFALTTFRLRYLEAGQPLPADRDEAAAKLAARLREFIRAHTGLRWSAASGGRFFTGRRRSAFADIAELDYRADGKLERIRMFLDPAGGTPRRLTVPLLNEALAAAVAEINRENRRRGGLPRRLERRLRRRIAATAGLSLAARRELDKLAVRFLAATFMRVTVYPADPAETGKRRFEMPDLRRFRNFGWGLLNLEVRFAADLSELDLWAQFHHVPTDGMPMQELLSELRREWGVAGPVLFPSPGTPAARPQMQYAGNGLFRQLFFVDFSPLLAHRRQLNAHYRTEMGGDATVAGMLIWKIAQNAYFADRKVLFPVDLVTHGGESGERGVGLVFIRPGVFFDRSAPENGEVRFQREFNRRVQTTRHGQSASTELLELYAMLHPLFYRLGHRLMPQSMSEFVGSMGLSVLRNAEIFLPPTSELQSHGFITVGDLARPAENGGTVGVVCVCATRSQLRHYRRTFAV